MSDAIEADPRIQKASELGEAIFQAAEALDRAIYEANKWGYHAKVRVVGVPIGDGCFIGHDKDRVTVRATVIFDIGRAI